MGFQISGVNPIKLFGINYIKIDVIQGKIYLVESVFDVVDAKIGFYRIDPRSHSNSRPFTKQPLFCHSKSGLMP